MNYRTFRDKRTPLFETALKAIRELQEAEGAGAVEDVCAEASSPLKQAAFLSREKVKRREANHVCPDRLKGAKRCSGDWRTDGTHERMPGSDHIDEWTKDGETYAITSQPYGLSYDDLKKIVVYCESNSLQAEIRAGSWHFPGRTLLLKYERAKLDSDKSARYLEGNIFRALQPASALSKLSRKGWNEWRLRMWVLADKARDASHSSRSIPSVFSSDNADELISLISEIPLLKI